MLSINTLASNALGGGGGSNPIVGSSSGAGSSSGTGSGSLAAAMGTCCSFNVFGINEQQQQQQRTLANINALSTNNSNNATLPSATVHASINNWSPQLNTKSAFTSSNNTRATISTTGTFAQPDSPMDISIIKE